MKTRSTIAQYDHFIPVATSSLIKAFEKSGLKKSEIEVIQKLKQVISFQFSQKLISLKELYQPFNPDREVEMDDSQSVDLKGCINSIKDTLLKANFSELNQQQIEFALQKTSPYGLEIKIDFSAFQNVSLFYRGKYNSHIQVRDWKTLYLKKKTVSLIRYQRLFLLLNYKDQQNKPGIHIKLFKDILRPDLEMLFPDCKIRMKVFDKVKLGITGSGGTAGSLFAVIGKITAAVSPWTIAVAIAGFAMLVWRQVSKILIQKTRYMVTLAQNLYFHNLDNNAGALNYLIDLARQEEIKETILAYALLKLKPTDSIEQLDSNCEHWLVENFGTHTDFEINDAVKKLKQFKIINNINNLSCEDDSLIINHLKNQWLMFID